MTVYYTPEFMLIVDVKNSTSFNYKKLSKNTILNISTGEVKTVTERTDENRDIGSLRKTFSRMSILINSNFFGGKSEVFVSMSYNKKISDYSEVNRDIKNLWGRFQRKNKKGIKFRCLVVLEYQGNGNHHIHMLLKRLDNQTLSTNEVKLLLPWKKGTIDIQRLYDSTGLSEYLNPFCVPRKKKRLKFYKRGMQIYRCYGEFVRPQKLKMSDENALKLAELYNLKAVKEYSYDVTDNTGNQNLNKIIKKLFKI